MASPIAGPAEGGAEGAFFTAGRIPPHDVIARVRSVAVEARRPWARSRGLCARRGHRDRTDPGGPDPSRHPLTRLLTVPGWWSRFPADVLDAAFLTPPCH